MVQFTQTHVHIHHIYYFFRSTKQLLHLMEMYFHAEKPFMNPVLRSEAIGVKRRIQIQNAAMQFTFVKNRNTKAHVCRQLRKWIMTTLLSWKKLLTN